MVKYNVRTISSSSKRIKRRSWSVDTGSSTESSAKKTKTPKKKTKKIKKSFLTKKFTSKPILKKNQVTIRVREHEPAPYVSRYMKEEMMNGAGTLDKGDILFK